MFQTKVVEIIKTHVSCSIPFFRNSCHLGDNAEEYGGAGEARDDTVTGRMRIACRVAKATNTFRM